MPWKRNIHLVNPLFQGVVFTSLPFCVKKSSPASTAPHTAAQKHSHHHHILVGPGSNTGTLAAGAIFTDTWALLSTSARCCGGISQVQGLVYPRKENQSKVLTFRFRLFQVQSHCAAWALKGWQLPFVRHKLTWRTWPQKQHLAALFNTYIYTVSSIKQNSFAYRGNKRISKQHNLTTVQIKTCWKWSKGRDKVTSPLEMPEEAHSWKKKSL